MIEGIGVSAGVCFRHDGFGDEAVFGNEGGDEVPPSAVFEGVVEGFPFAVEVIGIAHLDDGFEVEVGAFEFVPELEVRGGELEVVEAAFADYFGAEGVEGGEDPAAS